MHLLALSGDVFFDVLEWAEAPLYAPRTVERELGRLVRLGVVDPVAAPACRKLVRETTASLANQHVHGRSVSGQPRRARRAFVWSLRTVRAQSWTGPPNPLGGRGVG
jgi:hypothetical protein